jgi:hypothetical protein
VLDFLLATDNLPFTIALGLMLVLGGLELLSSFAGLGISDVLDDAVPDLDAGGDVGDVGGDSPLFDALHWVGFGQVPLLIFLVTFLGIFGFLGLVGQYATLRISGGDWTVPWWIAWLPVLMVSVAPTRLIAVAVGKVLPREETSAISESSFIGSVATITLGAARKGQPSQAKLRDAHGTTHYVMVEPHHDDEVLEAGEEVVLVAGERGRFLAVHGPLSHADTAAHHNVPGAQTASRGR